MGGKKKPKPTKKKDAPGSTHLSRDVKKGATKMEINSKYGFKVGDTIDIAPGTLSTKSMKLRPLVPSFAPPR